MVIKIKGIDDDCGILKRIKNFWQRGTRGYSDYDVLDFDQYLSVVIIDGLFKFRNINVSVPQEFCKDCSVDEGSKKWDAVIYKIIQGFSIAEDKHYLEMDDGEKKQFDESFSLFKKHFSDLWV